MTEKEKIDRIIAEFRLFDDDFMSEVLCDNIDVTELVLGIILERDNIKVKSVKTQVEYHNSAYRSIRLDVEAFDTDGKIYDIEIQRSDLGAGEKRARIHSSMLDKNLLEKGGDFNDVPDTYVIFITENDYFGLGVPLYHIDRTIAEKGHAVFSDGTHIIYVNGAYRNSEHPVGRLMHDFGSRNAESMYYSEISKSVKFYKESEGGHGQMCRLVEELLEEKAAEVRESVTKEVTESVTKEVTESATKKAYAQKTLEFAKKLISGKKLDYKTIAEYSGLELDMVIALAMEINADNT